VLELNLDFNAKFFNKQTYRESPRPGVSRATRTTMIPTRC
jgi:hypothetical protein